MKKINLKSISDPLSNKEMKIVTGGRDMKNPPRCCLADLPHPCIDIFYCSDHSDCPAEYLCFK